MAVEKNPAVLIALNMTSKTADCLLICLRVAILF